MKPEYVLCWLASILIAATVLTAMVEIPAVLLLKSFGVM